MKRKIVFIFESTFNKTYYHTFGFKILKNRGYKVIALQAVDKLIFIKLTHNNNGKNSI